MQVLFLEGANSLQGREKSVEMWKAVLAALTFSFHQAESHHSLGSSQAPCHRTFSLRSIPHPTSVLDFPLAPGPCLFSAGSGDWSPTEVSRSGPETHTHLVIFMASGGGVGMTTCSLRKIFTEVVFEVIAEGRAGCQTCVWYVCARGFRGQQLHLGAPALIARPVSPASVPCTSSEGVGNAKEGSHIKLSAQCLAAMIRLYQ